MRIVKEAEVRNEEILDAAEFDELVEEELEEE